MPPFIASLTSRWAAPNAVTRRDVMRIGLIAALHLAALALMFAFEGGLVANAIFLLTWGLLNFFWLVLLRRPAVSAALSLAVIVLLILLSRLKYDIIWMTANFLDVMIINTDTVRFLLSVKPDLYRKVLIAVTLAVPALALLWWIDSFRVRLRSAAFGFVVCLAGLIGVTLAYPQEEWEAFFGDSYVSKFSRSGVAAVSALLTQGYMESDASVTDRLRTLPEATCEPARKPPHIILVHDEFELRHPRRARHQGAGRLRQPLQVLRRQGAATSSPRARAARAGTPSTTCSRASRRARSDASPIT